MVSIFKHKGLTLIELMITLTILTILLLIGSSLSRDWIDRSQVDGVAVSLNTIVSQTKSAALRNTNNQPSEYAAASICYNKNNHTLNVVRTAAYTTNVCLVQESNSPEQNYILKTIQLPSELMLTVDQQDFECVAFNALGIVVPATGLSGSCLNQKNVEVLVKKNAESLTVQIN
jgi:type IV pilus assembly protein PilA